MPNMFEKYAINKDNKDGSAPAWAFDKDITDYWSGGDSYNRGTYVASDAVNAANAALQAQMANKPGAYQSQWQQQITDTINKITNRDKFSYDVNGDALYQQYKDKYIQQGKMASADVMGQAAAMTGGYGNSYAATVGNQAYQAHLNNLNDVIPELYQMAYNRYQDEGQDLYNQYSLFADRDNTEYGRHRDTVSDWQNDRNFLANRYDSERNFDYGMFSDAENANQTQFNADRSFAYGQFADDKNFAYTEHRNSIADQQWQANFDEAKLQYDDSVARAAASSGGSGGGGNDGLTPSEWNAINENASIYAESGKGSLSNYLNGLVNRGWLDGDEASDIFEQYFPVDYNPKETGFPQTGGGYRVGTQIYLKE